MNRNILNKIQRGFTLIELLIVIAVLGVLAAVILVAIDPVEQLARAEDAGRVTQVGQLASAMQAYNVSQNLTVSFTPLANTWQTVLVTAGEIKRTFTAPSGSATCGPAANLQTGYCYAPNAGNYYVWTFLESKSAIDRAEGTEGVGGVGTTTDPDRICNAAGTAAAYAYDSAQGKGGNTCLSTTVAPSGALTLF